MDRLPPVWDLTKSWTWNLGVCSEWELNPQPFGVQDNALQLSQPAKALLSFDSIF